MAGGAAGEGEGDNGRREVEVGLRSSGARSGGLRVARGSGGGLSVETGKRGRVKGQGRDQRSGRGSKEGGEVESRVTEREGRCS
eukprot:3563196-Rhodomonas_salina.1